MGYLHIENIYRPEAQRILCFKHLYALEKIHGTSAHIRLTPEGFGLFSGGEPHEAFVALLDGKQMCTQENLKSRLTQVLAVGSSSSIIIYGELYGGKCQGMRKLYGDQLKFVAFDVKIDGFWLEVPKAAQICIECGIDFVDYKLIPAEETAIDVERDRPSTQASRNGVLEAQIREGVVLRTPIEVILNNGARLIAKHKRPEFSERGKPPPAFTPERLHILEETNAIVTEWCTEMRLTHVLDKLGNPIEHRFIPDIVRAMVEDIEREASGEIVSGKNVRKAIGHKTVQMFKQRIPRILRNG